MNKYERNNFMPAIGTWLILKALTRSGFIQDWNKQKTELLQLCKCSESVFRSRLSFLHKKKFLIQDRKNIRLCSWHALAKILQIDTTEKKSFQYEKANKQRVHDWIIATEIMDNQARQSYMILKQVNKNPELNMQLTAAMIKDGADRSRLKDSGYFLSRLKSLYLSDFIQASDIHEVLIEVRPDTNRGVKGIASAWNAKHAMTVTYWKKILQTAGIINIDKIQVQSKERVRNKHCKVLWLPGAKETLLCLCDQITVLQPWLIRNLIPA